ncbi:MAG TPA: L,D-transpeptidase [Acidobacteriota bacterium]|nr:L,D-transpeptidase [Acidobacteriota bacterium]
MKICVRILCLMMITGTTFAAGLPTKLNDAIKVQVLLDRANFSSGEIDGSIGPRTEKALAAFQKSHGLDPTGQTDEATLSALAENNPDEPLISYTITAEDVAGPFVDRIPEDKMEQAKLEQLSYTSPLEAISEKFHVNPRLLKRLNPNAQFAEGEEILVPNVLNESPTQNGEQTQTTESTQTQRRNGSSNGKKKNSDFRIVVSPEDSSLVVENNSGDILFYAPVTSGSQMDPLPQGQWEVTGVTKNPVFNYNPELFWDADPSHSKAQIQPGPNNPVGVAWIDINKEHYGIHGSPEPSRIGKKESHGCVRLTNWDVQKLLQYAKPGTKVIFQ